MNTAGVARPSGSAGKSNFALQTGFLVAERRRSGGARRQSQLLKEPADRLQGGNTDPRQAMRYQGHRAAKCA